MRKIIAIAFAAIFIVACQSASEKKFTVSGTVTNTSAKKIYLERVPAATMQAMVEDSAELGKDGKFTLHAEPGESVVFNVRLGQGKFPVASVINDAENVKLSIVMSKSNNEFAEKYFASVLFPSYYRDGDRRADHKRSGHRRFFRSGR